MKFAKKNHMQAYPLYFSPEVSASKEKSPNKK